MLHGSRIFGISFGFVLILLSVVGSDGARADLSAAQPVYVYDRVINGAQLIQLTPASALPLFVGISASLSPDEPVLPIRICRYSAQNRTHYFISDRANCEGSTLVAEAGNVFVLPSPGLVPLFRCSAPDGDLPRGMKHWTTTDPEEAARFGATEKEHLGFVFPPDRARRKPEAATWVAVHSLIGGRDHMLSTLREEGAPTFVYERTEFYLSIEPTSPDDVPLYRCFINGSGHFADFSPFCEGGSREFRFGYIAKSARAGFVPLTRYKSKETPLFRWVTTRSEKEMKELGFVFESEVGYVSEKGLAP